MRFSTMAARDDAAQKRIMAAVEALAEHFGLPSAIAVALQVQRGEPRTRAMLQREAIASFLEALVEAVGSPQAGGGAVVEIEVELKPEIVEALKARGYTTPEAIREASVSELAKVPGIGKKMAARVKEMLG